MSSAAGACSTAVVVANVLTDNDATVEEYEVADQALVDQTGINVRKSASELYASEQGADLHESRANLGTSESHEI